MAAYPTQAAFTLSTGVAKVCLAKKQELRSAKANICLSKGYNCFFSKVQVLQFDLTKQCLKAYFYKKNNVSLEKDGYTYTP